MKQRLGFTVVELLICIAIFAAFVAIVCGSVGGCSPTGKSWGNNVEKFTARCTDKYTYANGTADAPHTSKRVDLRLKDGGVLTITCDDDYFRGISNSATLYSEFEENKWYEITTIGWRREGWMNTFPNCKQVRSVPEPE